MVDCSVTICILGYVLDHSGRSTSLTQGRAVAVSNLSGQTKAYLGCL